MANILVVHPPIMTKGGGEAVCMYVLESLQSEHDLTLLSGDRPDFNELNDYYGTSVSGIKTIEVEGIPSLGYKATRNRGGRIGHALINRYIVKNNLGAQYDLIISTKNDFHLPYKSIQYIHYPNFGRYEIDSSNSLVYNLYDGFCDKIARSAISELTNPIYAANSKWTARNFEEAFGQHPKVIYPPVKTEDFPAYSWSEMEDGFVSIGRVSKGKNILRNIEILSRIRRMGHNIHYHILGPVKKPSKLRISEPYSEQVIQAIDKRDFVHLEGAVSRARLTEMVAKHKYGIHGKDYEHFGIAVAELVTGKSIPFIPRTGGQKEIINEMESLMYTDTQDAVNKIDSVLNMDSVSDIQSNLPDIRTQFGVERFKEEINCIVENNI